MFLIRVVLLAVFVASQVVGCAKKDGTNTGNPGILPGIPSNHSNDPAGGIITEAKQLLGTVCTALQRCHAEVVWGNCLQALWIDPHMAEELGVSATFSNLQAISAAEISEEILVDLPNAIDCRSTLAPIACDAPEMLSAYQTADPGNFQNSFNLLKAEPKCSQIYSAP